MKNITWKIHLQSSPNRVYMLLTTAGGRKSFSAEEAPETDGIIRFVFPNGERCNARVVEIVPCRVFRLEYFGSPAVFTLDPCADGTTDLTLIHSRVRDKEFAETHAGWVSVLMNLKAVADHRCDLRNHDPIRTWNQGYVDN